MRYPIPARLLSGRIRADCRAARARLEAEPCPSGKLERRQLDAVSRVWTEAVADVPYYATLVREDRAPGQIRSLADLRAVPILTRKDIMRVATDRFLGYQRGNAYRLDRRRCGAIAAEIIRFRPAGKRRWCIDQRTYIPPCAESPAS